MNISDKTVRKLLSGHKKLAEAELSKLEQAATKQKKSLQETVLKRGVITDEELAEWYAEESGTPFIQLDPKKIDIALLSLFLNESPAVIMRWFLVKKAA